MKVKFTDKKILMNTYNVFCGVGALYSFIALFNQALFNWKLLIGAIAIIITFYIVSLIRANTLKKIKLNIKGSDFIIKQGDIFLQEGLKVINFNEYFDTIVDNKIIAKNSLNGKFIIEKVNDLEKLDSTIDEQLLNFNFTEVLRKNGGKNKKFDLGTIVEYNEYLLTAMTKFDDNNKANLTLREFLSFLMNFWNNLNIIYANRKVNITLFGSSCLTRITDSYEITEQELLEIIIWTFKISKIKFKYPNDITLILTKDLLNKINLYKVKEDVKNGL